MVSVTKTVTAALALTSSSIAGSFTYFYPGLGACGGHNGNNDYIVAVSAKIFDSQRPCNRRIRAWYKGRSVDVKVVDRCAGCAENDLDFSPAAFKALVGDLGPGRVWGDWNWT
ncbi:Allergen Asp f 7 [Beauveria bassiana]|uniref:Allergen Asp f 7 n=1 Tax=Beauveria bassiana TaxID=176275 RepID=A0A2N6NPV1_BEABA|nr:Allergen Asp f 7 [Beauveria bassiana]